MAPAIQSESFLPIIGIKHAAWRTTAALRHRDFRLLWFGACTSSTGTWMQAVAENWLVLSLTGSALFLGLDVFLQQVPILLLTLVSGVVADRRDRRAMLLVSQCVQMSCAAILAVLVYLGHIQLWHILTLSFVSGCAQAFGGPAYLALTPSLVGNADVSNAIALNALQFNIARFVGPLLAGGTLMALKHVGVSELSAIAVCFAVNGLSFLVVIAALSSLRIPRFPNVQSLDMGQELRLGLLFVRSRRALVAVVVISGVIAFTAYPILTLLPLFAEKVMQRGVEGYSALMVCVGAGAIAGSLLAAWLGHFPHMARAAITTASALGALMTAFAFSHTPWLIYLALCLIGAALMLVTSTLTALAQRMVGDEMRGRVMGVYMVASRGIMPLGNLACGYLASVTSASLALGLDGLVLCLVGAGCLISECEMRRW